ncbi:hypothetical protein R3P38DRAFT_3019749 [Favolaschia claudopus]|uniref:CCHC-type domain-containing protein n=1 Tax=Favolaschia claudopus TaxID=2862362 RepID=A0AAW0AKJ4_9AGAR
MEVDTPVMPYLFKSTIDSTLQTVTTAQNSIANAAIANATNNPASTASDSGNGTAPSVEPGQGDTPARPAEDTIMGLPAYAWLLGATADAPVVHGWTMARVKHNQRKVARDALEIKPSKAYKYSPSTNITNIYQASTLAAVFGQSDRPTDRAGGADIIAAAIVHDGLAKEDEFQIIPPIPEAGNPNDDIHPIANIITDCSVDLKRRLVATGKLHYLPDGLDRGYTIYFIDPCAEQSWYTGAYINIRKTTTPAEFLAALKTKLIADPIIVDMVRADHTRVLLDHFDLDLIVDILLHFARVDRYPVHAPGSATERIAFRLYMPAPSIHDVAIGKFKDRLMSPNFSFDVGHQGVASPFFVRKGRFEKPMECYECSGLDHFKRDCPLINCEGHRRVHPVADEQSNQPTIALGTTFSSMEAPAPPPTNAYPGSQRGGYSGRGFNGGGRGFFGGGRGGGYRGFDGHRGY